MEENEIIVDDNVIKPLKKEKESFTRLEYILAFAMLAVGFFFVRFVVWNVTGLYTTIFFMVTAFICLFYVKKSNFKLYKSHRIQFGLLMIFSIVFSLTANGFIKFLNIIFVLLLGAYWIYSVCKENEIMERYFFFAMIKAIFTMPFSGFDKAPKIISNSTSTSEHSKNVKFALFGLIITIPLTMIVALLLISADNGVEKMLNTLFNDFYEDIMVVIVQFALGLPVAFYIFGMLYSNVRKESKGIINDEICEKKLETIKIFPNMVMYSAITPICILYIMFFVSQLQYFLSAFNGILPDGYSYSQYARRGFFELFAIAIINLLILLTINFLSKQTGENKPVVLKLYSIILSVFTILILASALSKMIMYINNYGLTQLRIYVSWFMILLATIFVLIIIKQCKFQFHFAKYAVITFILFFSVLCFSNVDGNIARYNIQMYQSGLLNELDIQALCNYSDDALVYVLKSGIDTQDYLLNTLEKYENHPYLTYNISSFRVKKLLEGK